MINGQQCNLNSINITDPVIFQESSPTFYNLNRPLIIQWILSISSPPILTISRNDQITPCSYSVLLIFPLGIISSGHPFVPPPSPTIVFHLSLFIALPIARFLESHPSCLHPLPIYRRWALKIFSPTSQAEARTIICTRSTTLSLMATSFPSTLLVLSSNVPPNTQWISLTEITARLSSNGQTSSTMSASSAVGDSGYLLMEWRIHSKSTKTGVAKPVNSKHKYLVTSAARSAIHLTTSPKRLRCANFSTLMHHLPHMRPIPRLSPSPLITQPPLSSETATSSLAAVLNPRR